MQATDSRSEISVSMGAETDDGTHVQTTLPLKPEQRLDMEHALVADNPREWSDTRKVSTVNAHTLEHLKNHLCHRP